MEIDEEKILSGKIVSKKIKEDLKIEVDKLKEKGIIPKLAVIMVGDDEASKVYVRNKSKACEQVGVNFEEFLLPENTTEKELFNLIDRLNEDKTVNGILLQSPIPKHLDQNKAFRRIDPDKDVDGFNPVNVGDLCIGNDCFISCTPFGIMKILEYYNIAAYARGIKMQEKSKEYNEKEQQVAENRSRNTLFERRENLQKHESYASERRQYDAIRNGRRDKTSNA